MSCMPVASSYIYVIDATYAVWHYDAMDEANSERVITPMSKSLIAAVDDYRFANRAPSRAEAIRRLIELGLEAAKATEHGSAMRSPTG